MKAFSKRILEDYLKILFELQRAGKGIRVKDIAKRAKVSKGNVSQILRRLAENELVSYQPYKEIQLTEKGLQLVKEVTEKHAVSEFFIEKSLGIKEAHGEAHILEHALSDEVFSKMKSVLITEKKAANLNEWKENEQVEIIFTKISNRGVLARLNAIGLVPGERVAIVKRMKKGPIIVKVKGKEIAISREIIEKVFAAKVG